MRKIAILGSTGSIGKQCLSVCALHPDRFQVEALVCNTSKELLFEQVRLFRPKLAGLTCSIPMEEIPQDLRFCEWIMGKDALTIAAGCDCDDVLVSVVGMVGLNSVLTAFRNHKRVLLANKEALVTGGALVMEAAMAEGKNALLPVDSEHSAIFQCLQAAGENPIESIQLTCSGGPFRTASAEQIRKATKFEALKHPTWIMGQKITIDSATLFNKALEMMEAKWLFHVEESQIEVLIHPQSVVHSGITFADGAMLCQLGTADMRLPILYAMSFPERLPTGGEKLNLTQIGTLTFEKPDSTRFPSLRLMKQCMQAGGACGCILNAANEEAVARLLQSDGKDGMNIGLIYDTVEEVLNHLGVLPADSLETVLEADRLARSEANLFLNRKLTQ